MKTQQGSKNNSNAQGQSTSNRAFTNQNDTLREKGISNSGGQPSFTTSSEDSRHKPEHKKK